MVEKIPGKTKKGSVKVIIFDMYQTLVDIDIKNDEGRKKRAFALFSSYLLQNGIDQQKAERFQSLYDEELRKFYETHDKETRHHNFTTIISETFLKHFDLKLDEKDLADIIWEFRKIDRGYVKLYTGIQEMLETLSKDYTLILASYTQGVYSERELEELGIRKYFSHCVFSSYIGYKKRSDLFYKKCLEVANVESSNCVMVGDSLSEDVFMAKRNGLRVVWIINPLSKDKELPGVIPDASITTENINKLPDLIKNVL